ncbi:MAG: site-2 protease family protein [Clostridiales bacterium]|nr:site-2 protease family protein [Clostridiales bacterium]
MEYFGFIILSIVILLVMVLIHEAGHYTAAKILGFTVNEFSVGFGPKIFQKRRRNGELFSLRMLPLGGYCAFLGEDEETEAEKAEKSGNNVSADSAVADDGTQSKDNDLLSYVMKAKIDEEKKERAAAKPVESEPVRLDKDGNPAKTFNEHAPWKRIIVLLGGVLFNFLSAFIFSLIFIWAVGYAVPCIDTVYSAPDGTPYCNLRKGDVILAVDGKQISVLKSFSDLCADVADGRTVVLKVDRAGEVIEIPVTRQEITITDDDGKTSTYMGFGVVSHSEFVGNNAGTAFKYCVPYTFKLSWAILGSFGGLFTGKVAVTDMSGPVGSIKLMADVSLADARNILILLPLLASNLAIFNLLPFPALDGARIVFTTIEWIRKKPINRNVEAMINFVGIIVLLLFVLVIDILSFVL